MLSLGLRDIDRFGATSLGASTRLKDCKPNFFTLHAVLDVVSIGCNDVNAETNIPAFKAQITTNRQENLIEDLGRKFGVFLCSVGLGTGRNSHNGQLY